MYILYWNTSHKHARIHNPDCGQIHKHNKNGFHRHNNGGYLAFKTYKEAYAVGCKKIPCELVGPCPFCKPVP